MIDKLKNLTYSENNLYYLVDNKKILIKDNIIFSLDDYIKTYENNYNSIKDLSITKSIEYLLELY